MVTTDEKEKCSVQFKHIIKKLEEEEESIEKEISNYRKIESENELNYQSFVEYLNDYELFETMFEQDKKLYDYMDFTIHTFEEYIEYKFLFIF